jgi:hypothetical protein
MFVILTVADPPASRSQRGGPQRGILAAEKLSAKCLERRQVMLQRLDAEVGRLPQADLPGVPEAADPGEPDVERDAKRARQERLNSHIDAPNAQPR